MIIKNIMSFYILLSLASGTTYAIANDQSQMDQYSQSIDKYKVEGLVDNTTNFANKELLQKQNFEAILEQMKQAEENQQSYNSLANSIEESFDSLIENVEFVIKDYGVAGSWLLMQGAKAQLDFMDSIKEQSDKEEVFGNTLMMGVSIGFMPVGIAMMWPGLKSGLKGLHNYTENRVYKSLLAERTRSQGKIEKLNHDIKMRLSVEKIPQDVRHEILESQNKSAKKLFNDNQQKISKARESLSKLEKRIVTLDKLIKTRAPVPRVTNYKTRFKNNIKIYLKSIGLIAGAVVFQQSTIAANVIELETDDPLAGMKYYSYMKDLYQDLSDRHQELTEGQLIRMPHFNNEI